MARLRPDRVSPRRRISLLDFRRAEPDTVQLAIGLMLVVVALVGLAYTFTL